MNWKKYVKITFMDSITLLFLLNKDLQYKSERKYFFLKSIIAFLYVCNCFEDVKKNVKCLPQKWSQKEKTFYVFSYLQNSSRYIKMLWHFFRIHIPLYSDTKVFCLKGEKWSNWIQICDFCIPVLSKHLPAKLKSTTKDLVANCSLGSKDSENV